MLVALLVLAAPAAVSSAEMTLYSRGAIVRARCDGGDETSHLRVYGSLRALDHVRRQRGVPEGKSRDSGRYTSPRCLNDPAPDLYADQLYAVPQPADSRA
jgi:hypothetical protein